MAAIFGRISGVAARRPLTALAIVAALAITGGILALGLKPSAGIDTFVSRSSPAFKATADDERHFGDDAVIILVHEKLTDLVQTTDLATITRLEACLGGHYVQANSTLHAFTAVAHAPYGGWSSPCGHLMASHAAQVVYGPGTFLNQAVAAVNTGISSLLAGARAAGTSAARKAYALAIAERMGTKKALADANAAGQLEYQRQLTQMERLAATSGLDSIPSIEDPQLVGEIVFDQSRGADQPKARFAYLFPTADSALIQVRLRSSLSDTQQARAIGWIRQAIRMPMFHSAHHGVDTVTGVPVVINDLAGQITGAIAGLFIAVLLVMAATLLIVFRNQLRLLPLAIALAAAGITFGLLAALGVALTMASIAVVPILIGLAVDYGIQLQARAQETRSAAEREGRAAPSAAEAVAQAAGRAAPTIATAALATATGFLVLLLSPVPMVRGFGLVLVAGIAIALVCALTVVPAALVLAERQPGSGPLAASLRGAGELLAAPARAVARAVRDARDIIADAGRRLGRLHGGRAAASLRPRIITGVMRHPGRVLALAGVLAVAGWIADTQTAVQSDVTKLVPASMPALRGLTSLEKVTGVSGEIDVAVRGADVASPKTLRWMIAYENALLSHYGYADDAASTHPCAHATLCPALSLPDLFSTGQSGAGAGLSQTEIDTLLRSVPRYFSQAVLTGDHREATLAFGIRLMALAREQQVIDYMRSRLHPPPGVSAALTGLPVLAAQANQALSSSGRRFLTLIAALFAVGLVLLVVLRQPRRAIVPLIPIVLATGWSALILYLIGIPLNPMSATLGTLVIAISTEFSVLLSERLRQELVTADELRVALARTYRSTGRAVLASGITAIVGFGVLVFSNITMLRDFGFVTLVDLTVSLSGVLFVLPAVMVLSGRDARARARSPRRILGHTLGRRRRRGPRTA